MKIIMKLQIKQIRQNRQNRPRSRHTNIENITSFGKTMPLYNKQHLSNI